MMESSFKIAIREEEHNKQNNKNKGSSEDLEMFHAGKVN